MSKGSWLQRRHRISRVVLLTLTLPIAFIWAFLATVYTGFAEMVKEFRFQFGGVGPSIAEMYRSLWSNK